MEDPILKPKESQFSQKPRICQHFTRFQTCKFGQNCRFQHIQEPNTINKKPHENHNNNNIEYKKKKLRLPQNQEVENMLKNQFENLQIQQQKPEKRQQHYPSHNICKFYKAKSCKNGKNCNFSHPPDHILELERQKSVPYVYDIDNIKKQNTIDKKELKNLDINLHPSPIINMDQEQKHQLEQYKKTNKMHKITFIRHGLSVYNFVAQQFTHVTGNIYCHPDALKYQIDHNLLDAPLHFYGKLQCQNAQQYVNNKKIHTIFVSPLRRTLETCYLMFKNHKQFINKEIKIIVLPLITEILSKVQDLAGDIQQLKKEYEQYGFDFSLIQDIENQEGEKNWQLNNLLDEKLRELLLKKMNFQKQTYQNIVLKNIEQIFPDQTECRTMLYHRSQKAKQFIKNYIEENNVDCEKENICIVSHCSLMREFMKLQGQESKGNKMQNCQVFQNYV